MGREKIKLARCEHCGGKAKLDVEHNYVQCTRHYDCGFGIAGTKTVSALVLWNRKV